MFEKLRQSKLMFWSLELLIIAALIMISSEINFIFEPIGTFFSTLFAPVLIAGFLYYLLNPIVKLLNMGCRNCAAPFSCSNYLDFT